VRCPSALVVLLCEGVQLQKLASTYGDLRVYDVIDDANPKSTEKKSKRVNVKTKAK